MIRFNKMVGNEMYSPYFRTKWPKDAKSFDVFDETISYNGVYGYDFFRLSLPIYENLKYLASYHKNPVLVLLDYDKASAKVPSDDDLHSDEVWIDDDESNSYTTSYEISAKQANVVFYDTFETFMRRYLPALSCYMKEKASYYLQLNC